MSIEVHATYTCDICGDTRRDTLACGSEAATQPGSMILSPQLVPWWQEGDTGTWRWVGKQLVCHRHDVTITTPKTEAPQT